MPRKARVKSMESIYHIMCRSVSEFLLFRDDEDKDYYLSLIKRYVEKYKCSLYAFCLMDNHLHLHLDPKGFDLSKFMHSLNTAYVRYYNKKYDRHGHVFQERFESKIIDTEAYNFAVSAYIHNNPKDIEGYAGKEEQYPYSSYGIYLGLRPDIHKLIDISFMMQQFNLWDPKEFTKRYFEFVSHHRDFGTLSELNKNLKTAFENQYISGRSIIIREHSPAKVMSFIAGKLVISNNIALATKTKKKLLQYRAFTVYVLRVLCGLSYKEICSSISNMTISGCSRLCSKGYELLTRDPFYEGVFEELAISK